MNCTCLFNDVKLLFIMHRRVFLYINNLKVEELCEFGSRGSDL